MQDRVKIDRIDGTCRVCGVEGRVMSSTTTLNNAPCGFEGYACARCILDGDASDLPLTHASMKAVVWTARAESGEEPYASMLRAAVEQAKNPEAAQRTVDQLRERDRLISARRGTNLRLVKVRREKKRSRKDRRRNASKARQRSK